MPNSRPPTALPGTPTKVPLPAGTPLFRVHASKRPGTAFNPVPSDCLYDGGRFDATRCDDYPFLYAGRTAPAAVCESLLRSVPFTPGGGVRLLPRASVRGKRLSFLRLTADVDVVSLVSGADLASVAQDAWLVQSEPGEYAYTRHWGHWIRGRTAPWAQGFVWPSKREPAAHAVILFQDRCLDRGLTEIVEETDEPPVDFATPEGERWLNSVLAPYLAQIAP
ncbi:RES family NAD+ phosphorylase [Streptomyces scopuliridis]|uniref:RES family NAD+ phosphorylase n=1 Tax=Streptomyces scopuliridis TaxID=452529 RepID=A0ACD4ZJU2_9ACTN|nr:RES family NAD+ phosphorylase [Streptomyces scopuliridis]WSB34363.1 RES family NAD+ phosphorylase [Streptomyces scopuliridis]WSB98633.1 RES family NAD+ phosphorylase [Streptomyces scopuliridis]WSC07664.1 RES family NAD+ phosphorylase [Streptomyces scopuliridis]